LDNVKLIMDGREIMARSGASLLDTAREAGIYIPTLCFEQDLEPLGGCRLCLVEVKGMRGLPAACTTPVSEGMVVNTSTPEINRVRRNTVELLLANHPEDCLTCVKNQRCELQKVAAYLGITERRFRRTAEPRPVDESNPFFKLDHNYCIMCQRCTRACDEVTVVNAIEVLDRGPRSKIGTSGDKPFMESICRSCGECVVRCPVGALVPKNNVVPTSEVLTTCCYCAVGCSMYLGVRDGRIVSVRGNHEGGANRGKLCVKGRFGISEFVHHPDRLNTPLIRHEKGLAAASWDEALDMVAGRLKGYTPDEIAVVASARCTNEDIYVTQKLARAVLGTNNVDHCARL